MSISFLSVFSNVSVCSAHLIILFHPSSDLLTITTSRDRPFSPLVANQTVVHLWRWSILCNFPLHLSDNSSSTSFTSDGPVRNLGVTFDPHLSFSNHISNLSRSCFMHIRDLRRIRP